MNAVVYYPHLVPDVNWLKMSALCWDRVYVLHPKNRIPFPEDIELADSGMGSVLTPLDTQEIGQDHELTQTFSAWLDKNTGAFNRLAASDAPEDQQFFSFFRNKLPFELYQKLQEHNLVIYEDDERALNKTAYYSVGPESKDFLDFSEKQPGEGALEYVKRMKAEQPGRFEKHSTNIYLPAEVALHYLSLCAGRAAKMKRADLYGENNLYFETIIDPSSELLGQVTQNIVKAYLPEDLSAVPPEQIRQAREDLSGKRALFQSEIQGLVKKLQEVSSEDDLESLKRRIQSVARERIDHTQNTFKNNKISLVLKSIGVSLTPPALAGYIASTLCIGIAEPIGIGLSLALFTGNSILEYNKARSDYDDSAWSYIHDIKRKIEV